VNPFPLSEDEAAHARVPAPRLVTEVNSGLQQLLDAYLGHLPFLSLVWSATRCGPPVGCAPRRGCGNPGHPGSVPCLSAGVGCKVRGIVDAKPKTPRRGGRQRRRGHNWRLSPDMPEESANCRLRSDIPSKLDKSPVDAPFWRVSPAIRDQPAN